MYQSSSANRSRRPVPALPFTHSTARPWKPKSRVAGSLPVVEYCDWKAGEPSNTSPNMKKSSLPTSSAASCIAGPNDCQNSMLTCLTVSIRKPSTPNSTHAR